MKIVEARNQDAAATEGGTSPPAADIDVRTIRKLLDALPSKRKREDDGDVSDSSVDDEDGLKLSSYKKHKQMEKQAYEEWKSTVISSNKKKRIEAPNKSNKQAQLSFSRKNPITMTLEAS